MDYPSHEQRLFSQEATCDLSLWAGDTVRLWFGNRQDGWGDQNAVWIDNIFIEGY